MESQQKYTIVIMMNGAEYPYRDLTDYDFKITEQKIIIAPSNLIEQAEQGNFWEDYIEFIRSNIAGFQLIKLKKG